ncbi:MAG TPA: asparagine synthase (glutamine-hydrolyzing) [Vicinamibacterales bacterium]|nr:asparagine synthase (glutamine-hydrolyzing) [Vicinamibacterales bacterium]
MCGIAGFADSAAPRLSVAPVRLDAEFNLVHRMCEVIRHRGPDDEGIHVQPGLGLGMRRLSIIDLAGGRQPIHNETSTIRVVFNGEIYNYRELRAELEALGHAFSTSSDTESIVHAYEEWGEDAFRRLRGMFAIALWDQPNRTLLLARDRAGQKPLHYAERGGRLYFASEIKSLLAAGAVEPALDLAALDHYLAFLYTPRDRSIFRGVKKLPPGHFLRWRDGRADVVRYWQVAADETFAGSEADAVAQLRQVLAEAVSSHMVSDVPLGAFLSGGVDSSAVVGMMAQASPRPVKTFSIGFDDPAYDELEHARTVARHFGTEHHEFVVKPDGLSILDDLISHFDEPFADSSAIPTWYVSEIARRHVTVVLSGDGGDELFGGYDRYLPHPRVAAFDRVPLPGLRSAAALAWPLLPHGTKGKNFLRHVAKDDAGRYLDSITFFPADERAALYAGGARAALASNAEAALWRHFERFQDLPHDSRMMRFDFETYLPEDVLTKVDRMSMAHSIESRVPLLDNLVIDFAATLPSRFKIRSGRRKHVLKEALKPLLPTGILDRRKQGFGIPLGTWFRGGLTDLFSDVLESPRARQRGYFEPAFVSRLLREHLSGQRDHTLRLWQLTVFELWHRQYLDTAVVGSTAAHVV